MIILYEHNGYAKGTGFVDLSAEQHIFLNKQKNYEKHILFNEKVPCFHIECFIKEQKLHCKTNYFIGVDWIVENKLAIYVKPKLNKQNIEIDYLRMLFDALETPDNFEHLDGLCEVYFNKPTIEITQGKDLLTPFLIVQFLQILKKIVKKGLKKTYYPVTSSLEAKIKGKVLINKTIKENLTKNKMTRTICQYNEFGINCEENKILKKTYIFCCHAISKYKTIFTKNGYLSEIEEIIKFIRPAFEQISNDINVNTIKTFKTNTLYKEYEQALKISLMLLKQLSYNITQTENKKIATYPFWIDMSKLFELYVYSKLRKIFPNPKEIIYQQNYDYHIPDYLLNSKDTENNPLKMVIDAKYKPQYHTQKVSKDDMQQVASYARLEKVYKLLEIDTTQNIDCLVIYANQQAETNFTIENLKNNKEKVYVNFYKVGIKLPEINY